MLFVDGWFKVLNIRAIFIINIDPILFYCTPSPDRNAAYKDTSMARQ